MSKPRRYTFVEQRTYPQVATPPQPKLVWREVHGVLVQVKVYRAGDRLRDNNTFLWTEFQDALHLAVPAFDLRG